MADGEDLGARRCGGTRTIFYELVDIINEEVHPLELGPEHGAIIVVERRVCKQNADWPDYMYNIILL